MVEYLSYYPYIVCIISLIILAWIISLHVIKKINLMDFYILIILLAIFFPTMLCDKLLEGIPLIEYPNTLLTNGAFPTVVGFGIFVIGIVYSKCIFMQRLLKSKPGPMCTGRYTTRTITDVNDSNKQDNI